MTFLYYALGTTSRKKTVNWAVEAALSPLGALLSRRKAPWETCKHARCQMSTDPRLRISLTLDVVACGKVGACLGLGYRRPAAAAHGPLAGCVFARPPVCSPAHPYPLTRKLPLSCSRSLSLSHVYAHVLLLVLFGSTFERWAFAGFGFVVRSFGLSGAASDSRHTRAARQTTIRITASQKCCNRLLDWLQYTLSIFWLRAICAMQSRFFCALLIFPFYIV